MRTLLHTLVLLAFAAGCASAPPPKKRAAKVKKVFKAAHTVEEVQAAFDEGVRAMQAPTPDYETATAGFEAAVKASPNFPAARFNLGLIAEARGQMADAERHYRAAHDMLPDEQRGVVLLAFAKLYLQQPDRLDDAESALQSLLAKDPENLIVKHNLAVLYRKQKDYDTALKFLREILAREAKNIAALNELGLLYLDQKNLSMSQWILGKAMQYSKKTPNADVFNNMGLLWMAKGETPGAVQMFQKALGANPGHNGARKNLGALYVQYLNFVGAQEQYAAVISTNESDLEARLGLATSLFGMAQFEPAETQYKVIIDRMDNNPRSPREKRFLGKAHYQLGRLYQEYLRDQVKALESYKQWILHANPLATHPKLGEIQLLEDMVRRGIKDAATAAEQAKKEKEERKAAAAAKAAEAKASGVGLDAPPPPDPNDPAAPADPNAPAVPADPNASAVPADPNAPAPAAPGAPNAAAPGAPNAAPAAAPEGAAAPAQTAGDTAKPEAAPTAPAKPDAPAAPAKPEAAAPEGGG